MRWLVLGGVLALAACEPAPEPLPAEPSTFVSVRHYGFGDSVGARDVKAWINALDLLEPAYGKFRRGIRQLPIDVSPEAVRAELAARLEPQDWTPVPELDSWSRYDGSYAFGWRKNGSVYAIVGLKHRPTMRTSPVNIISNIPGETSYIPPPGDDS